MIPSSRPMLSRGKRLPLDTWNSSGSHENVFSNQFSTFDSSQNHHLEIHHCTTPREIGSVPQAIGTGTSLARDEERVKGTTPMPTFGGRPSTMSSLIPVDVPQNSMVGQQRQQVSELQFDKFPAPSTFFCWKTRFQIQVIAFSDFPSEPMLWIKEVEMVDSVDEKSSRSINCRQEFPEFRNAGREDCFCFQKDHSTFKLQEEGQSRRPESPKRGSFSTRKTDRFHDPRLLSSDWRS